MLQTGSTDVSGQVDTTNQAATQNALSSATSLGGLPVASASLQAVSDSSSGTETEDWRYYRNVAIIVGVVIPVGLSNILIYI